MQQADQRTSLCFSVGRKNETGKQKNHLPRLRFPPVSFRAVCLYFVWVQQLLLGQPSPTTMATSPLTAEIFYFMNFILYGSGATPPPVVRLLWSATTKYALLAATTALPTPTPISPPIFHEDDNDDYAYRETPLARPKRTHNFSACTWYMGRYIRLIVQVEKEIVDLKVTLFSFFFENNY